MTSSARQAFERHSQAVRDRDLDAIVAGYAPDAVLAAGGRIGRGHDFVRAAHAAALGSAAALEPELDVHEDGDVLFVTWRSDDGPRTTVGTNTFVVREGLITLNTGYQVAVGALEADPA